MLTSTAHSPPLLPPPKKLRKPPPNLWLTMSGLPGCGKSTLIDEICPEFSQKGWQIVQMPEDLCIPSTLNAFFREPKQHAFQLQSEAIEKYTAFLYKLRSILEQEQQPFIVIEHTSVNTLFQFTNVYEHMQFLSVENWNALLFKFHTARHLRNQLLSCVTSVIKIMYNSPLDVAQMNRNILHRERTKSYKVMYSEALLQAILSNVESARRITDFHMQENHVITINYEHGYTPSKFVLDQIEIIAAATVPASNVFEAPSSPSPPAAVPNVSNSHIVVPSSLEETR